MSLGKQIYYHVLRENLKNMHPKLKELAVQAGAYPEGNTVLVGPMDTAKFAELIVRECANIVNSIEQYEGPDDCSTAEYIKEYFGVNNA